MTTLEQAEPGLKDAEKGRSAALRKLAAAYKASRTGQQLDALHDALDVFFRADRAHKAALAAEEAP